MISDKNKNHAVAHSPSKGAQSSGSPRLARRSPASRDNKAALTLGPVGDEAGADSVFLAFFISASFQCQRRRSP